MEQLELDGNKARYRSAIKTLPFRMTSLALFFFESDSPRGPDEIRESGAECALAARAGRNVNQIY